LLVSGRGWKTCDCPLWHEERLLAGDPAENRQDPAVPLPSRKSRGGLIGQTPKPAETTASPGGPVLHTNIPSQQGSFVISHSAYSTASAESGAVHGLLRISSSGTATPPQRIASSSQKATKHSRHADYRSSSEMSPFPDLGTKHVSQSSSSSAVTPTTVVSHEQEAVTFPAFDAYKPVLDARGWHPVFPIWPDPAISPPIPGITEHQGLPSPYLFGPASVPFHSIAAPSSQAASIAQPSLTVPKRPAAPDFGVSSYSHYWLLGETRETFPTLYSDFVFPPSPARNWPEEFQHRTIAPFSVSFTKHAKTAKMDGKLRCSVTPSCLH
jgi:hypothetical protein